MGSVQQWSPTLKHKTRGFGSGVCAWLWLGCFGLVVAGFRPEGLWGCLLPGLARQYRGERDSRRSEKKLHYLSGGISFHCSGEPDGAR